MVTYVPQMEYIFGNTFVQIVGDPIIVGLILLLVFFVLWAMVGAGIEAGIVIFIPLMLIFANYQPQLLPMWLAFLISFALALMAMFLLRGFNDR